MIGTIAKFCVRRKVLGLSAWKTARLAMLWEKEMRNVFEEYHVPVEFMFRHNAAIAEILLPFISPLCDFALQAPHPKLFEIARRGIFWTEVQDIRIVSPPGADLSIEGESTLATPDGRYEEDGQIGEYFDRLASHRVGGTHTPLRVTIERMINSAFQDRAVPEELFPGSISSGRIARNALEVALRYALVFTLTGDYHFDFTALLRLWRIGNFPIAIDRDSRLVIVCAAGVKDVPKVPMLSIVK